MGCRSRRSGPGMARILCDCPALCGNQTCDKNFILFNVFLFCRCFLPFSGGIFCFMQTIHSDPVRKAWFLITFRNHFWTFRFRIYSFSRPSEPESVPLRECFIASWRPRCRLFRRAHNISIFWNFRATRRPTRFTARFPIGKPLSEPARAYAAFWVPPAAFNIISSDPDLFFQPVRTVLLPVYNSGDILPSAASFHT